MNSFMAAAKGGSPEFAILLLCLLLGFNLDAYIVMGKDKHQNPDMWILTIEIDGAEWFWNPITSQRTKKQECYDYMEVGCCFNASVLYGNIQIQQKASETDFDFLNCSKWKSLIPDSQEAFQSKLGVVFPQISPFYNPNIVVDKFENDVRKYINHFREQNNLTCSWNENMAHILRQSLWRLEMQKLGYECTNSANHFELGVQRMIPKGHSFRAFPLNFSFFHSMTLFEKLKEISYCREILLTRGNNVRMALNVQIFPYGDEIASMWIIIAVESLAVQ